MSLINDALKRAREAQMENEVEEGPIGPHLLPAEPREKLVRGVGLVLPGALTLIALLVLLLVWMMYQGHQRDARDSGPDITAKAKSPRVPMVSPPRMVEPTPEPAPKVQPAAVIPAQDPTQTLQSTGTPATVQTVAVTIGTNLVLAPKSPERPALKLQSVVVHPTQPSAMINGKFLRIGDRVAGFRLVAITAETATVVNSSATNVLHLSE